MKIKYEEETIKAMSPKVAMEEASRCLLCLDAPCSTSCPAGTDPGKFIRSLRFRNIEGAAETIRENNALGSICARVCPTEKYCQKGCSRSGIDRPIDIGGIQRFITDYEASTHMSILKAGKDSGKKIAIIGSGPGGLQTAASCRQMGHQVTIFEKDRLFGGVLRYGIPEFRLPKDVVDLEIKRIEDMGVKLVSGVTFGKDITLPTLEKEFDAIVIATGYDEGKVIPIFKGNPYVETATNFLKRVSENPRLVSIDDKVLVIGGGDVAMDVDVTLKKLGCPYVIDVVYEELNEFKASNKEKHEAMETINSLITGYVPISIKENVVTFKHRFINSTIDVEADKIILAVGQYSTIDKITGLKLAFGEVENNYYKTILNKTFVAGDIAPGEKSVVGAVKTGKTVAKVINEFLGGK